MKPNTTEKKVKIFILVFLLLILLVIILFIFCPINSIDSGMEKKSFKYPANEEINILRSQKNIVIGERNEARRLLKEVEAKLTDCQSPQKSEKQPLKNNSLKKKKVNHKKDKVEEKIKSNLSTKKTIAKENEKEEVLKVCNFRIDNAIKYSISVHSQKECFDWAHKLAKENGLIPAPFPQF